MSVLLATSKIAGHVSPLRPYREHDERDLCDVYVTQSIMEAFVRIGTSPFKKNRQPYYWDFATLGPPQNLQKLEILINLEALWACRSLLGHVRKVLVKF